MTEPVAWVGLGIPDVDGPDFLSFKKPLGQAIALYPESVLTDEREESARVQRILAKQIANEREARVKAEAALARVREELAAMVSAWEESGQDSDFPIERARAALAVDKGADHE